MEILEAIKKRRSIRKYKAIPVDDESVGVVLEAARWAPSWKNTQCWRFIVVRDDKIKAQLADTLWFNPPTLCNPSIGAIREAPVVIVACAELGKAGYRDGEVATDKGDWFMFDVALTMQNLVLTACSLGLGTVHVGGFDAKKAAGILEVPQGFCVVEMTPLGYPDEEPEAKPRRGLSESVFYDKYGVK